MRLYAVASASLAALALFVPHATRLQAFQQAAPAAAAPAAPQAPNPLAGGYGSAGPDVPNTQTAELNPDQLIWAYTPSPHVQRPPDDGSVQHVPGSLIGFTRAQIRDGFEPPDWFPDSHPTPPKEVLHGRRPGLQACALCHLPTGYGRPENESINGLPVAYILQQIDDFKNDRRHRSLPQMGNTSMIPVAKNLTPEEAKEAAEYFAAIKPVKWIKIVETNTVHKTHPNAGMLAPDEGNETEPIGNRVIEYPENVEYAEMRDSKISFLAFAPVGSFKKGEELVRKGGNGKTIACITCHGDNLKGMGIIPPIAGRSPSQMARQLYDFKTGSRNGTNAVLMKGPVKNLTDTDIVNIVAYLSSLDQ